MLFRTKRILSPIDFSAPSRKGLAAAIELAERTGCELVLLHVVPLLAYRAPDIDARYAIPEYERFLWVEGARMLDETAKNEVPAGLPTRKVLRNGTPAQEIAEVAREEDVDVIVMATHGETGWRHLLFGSVAEKVMRAAHCPVLTVRRGDEATEPTRQP